MFSNLNIIIINWNLKADTLACLRSLIKSGVIPGQIIVVDNGSDDGSVKAFKDEFDTHLTIIENSDNVGYAKACNQGIELAIQQRVEWILLLNNDTTVAENFLEEMERANESKDKFAIYSPLIFYFTKPNTIWYSGDQRIPGTLITKNPYRGKEPRQNLPEIIPVDFVNGCGMLINRKVFETIGLFDPAYIMYGEEVDFCWRAHLAGFRMATLTKAHMWHKISLSANRDKPRARYLKIRNQIRFYRKYSHGLQLVVMFTFSIIRSSLIGLNDLFRHQSELLAPLYLGWYDGWREYYE
jgi:GT2 family glycosyltransferase